MLNNDVPKIKKNINYIFRNLKKFRIKAKNLIFTKYSFRLFTKSFSQMKTHL